MFWLRNKENDLKIFNYTLLKTWYMEDPEETMYVLIKLSHSWIPVRALGNAELRVLVCTFFPWDAWFSQGRSSAYACFFSWHALKIQKQRWIHTERSKALWYYRSLNTFRAAGNVIIVLPLLTNRMTRTAVKQFWQVIDRITDAGQCDYYEVIIKVIKQGLSDETDALQIYR